MPPVRRQISPFAHAMRQDATDVEMRMWMALRGRRLDSWKFKRQATIGRYVVDFLCIEARLVIELDGGPHSEQRDASRTALIEAAGYRVIRFWNNEVVDNFDGVLASLRIALGEVRPSPNPLPHAGEG
ncbi:endonuclease domain-containing protein [Sphingomonas montanisoli]|uniref:DUF559 domain-containing protein n=1 Tax=Sphingomonas montanisoli TaxID=2606412 RepID=A0A5D9C7J8_9SPHN|nr:DUF559 domain-containing protein [Sphingomonas montanisoli]TZG27734.1 DUF559 domain-containing protein [Sphingomonas montanisoli]